ncbi:putative serine/threonine/tyrosine-interacting protein [Apostichopus japonicus]|uniref:Putative serine/threonine/tyrosine-interacting protein n=1 Tax=Stichopus japonicus TaxID=307972 RepID=A0A2G8KRE5_STIJA|nr:putative serine/threonine/tyrosine-interacting protein [Apostichopus japonicus]
MLGKRYAKRRDMQEIIPGLFLGPYAVAKKDQLQYLQGNGITHIVCVRCPMEAKIIKPNFPDQVNPSLVIGYLMESFKIPFLDALRYVCERRPCCSPNLGFQRQLEEYEHIIMAKEEVSEHRKENLYSQQMVEVLIVGSDTHLHIISDPEHR